jgi:tRNA U54 and U55 pseudouridine synthase Pus10
MPVQPGTGMGGAAAMPGHPNVANTALDGPVEKVAKAAGPDARTVAEVYAQRAQLKGKPVVVQGKVVKVSNNIMGKNWVHLRDGSGSESDGTNDLLVTTKNAAQTGVVVTVRGVVHTDVDLGMGYTYKALVEDATLK